VTARSSPAGNAGAALGSGVRDLLRAALAPAVCGAVLLALLSSWVLTGGGGTISRVRITVPLAAVPMSSYTARGEAGRNALAYVTIRNISGASDELQSASSPDAARVVVTTRPAVSGVPPAAVIAVPAGHSVNLTPFGPGLVLIRPKLLTAGQQVTLRLRFRVAGVVTIQAVVTPPGTP
jgi:copper(I)-binding protein